MDSEKPEDKEAEAKELKQEDLEKISGGSFKDGFKKWWEKFKEEWTFD